MTLSILLPSYNNRCLDLVTSLQRQAEAIDGLTYEIIVADDGGSDMEVKAYNDAINRVQHCRYIRREQNVGRAVIRNFLAQEAQGEYLLFLDSDLLVVCHDMLQRYLSVARPEVVIDGGVTIVGDPVRLRSNLRFWYEYNTQCNHVPQERSRRPYQSIRTTNLFVPRGVFMQIPFDERFTRYGYEDVLFGKGLKQAAVPILHIDAPMGIDSFDTNDDYLAKIEEALHTLHCFEDELDGYSSLITVSHCLKRWHVRWAVRLIHCLLGGMMRRSLLSARPSTAVFKIYKTCLYASL